jgi:GLPGLI family protein
MKKVLFLYLLLSITSIKAQTLTGIYIFQSNGGVGDDAKLTEKAKIPDIYEYKYSNYKSNFQLLSKGGVHIDTLKRKLQDYDFDYETVETTTKPTKVCYYKDLKKNTFERIYTINNNESFVKDALPLINWEITNEKKIINGYECTKAIADRKILGYTLKLSGWFCERIPILDGPLDYNGLPGFIMELEADGLFVIKFINLQYNANASFDIKPSESKEQPLTLEQFEKKYR